MFLSMSIHATAAIGGLEKLAGTPKERQLWERLALVQRKNILPPGGRIVRREDEHGRTYQPSKRALADGGYTLWDQGHMLPAIQPRGVTSFGSRLGFNSVTEAKKAGWHHFGTMRMKARPFWGFAPRDLEALEKYKREFIEEAVRRSGLGR